MQEITLKIADNGVIKTVTDDNINAAGEKYESVIVYDFDKGIDDRLNFIKDICIIRIPGDITITGCPSVSWYNVRYIRSIQ